MQSVHQGLVLILVRGNHEDARLAANRRECRGAIVLWQRVGGGIDADVVTIETGLSQSLGESKKIFARGKLHLLLAEILLVAIEADRRTLSALRLHEDFYFEWLSLF